MERPGILHQEKTLHRNVQCLFWFLFAISRLLPAKKQQKCSVRQKPPVFALVLLPAVCYTTVILDLPFSSRVCHTILRQALVFYVRLLLVPGCVLYGVFLLFSGAAPQLTLGIVDPLTGCDAVRFAIQTARRNGRAVLLG